MKMFGTALERVKDWWLAGVFLLVILGAALAAGGTVAAIVLGLVGLSLGWSEQEIVSWLLPTAFLWVPAALGSTAPALKRYIPVPPLHGPDELPRRNPYA
ncbi:MAG TPA: hypothetical protein VNT25_04025 [Allosphingosinicella sp.]|nr:hypothetical protein [Allosphingosinicella sp.]